MRRTFIAVSAILFVLTLFACFGWAIEPAPYNKVVFYQDGDCDTGNYMQLGVGDYADLRTYNTGGSGSPNWNDQISCMTIGEEISKVIVYEHINFGGKSKTFSKTSSNPLGSWSLSGLSWNDKISSVKVIGPGYERDAGTTTGTTTGTGTTAPACESPANKVVFYQDGGYSGNYMQLGMGNYPDLRTYNTGAAGSPNWNDQISSMAIGSGITKVIVYEHINYGGSSKEFKRTSSNPNGCWTLGGDWWNDNISSIKVQ